jgi:hypothetical protein
MPLLLYLDQNYLSGMVKRKPGFRELEPALRAAVARGAVAVPEAEAHRIESAARPDLPLLELLVALFKKLRRGHPKLRDLGPRGEDIEKVLNACSSILDALNPVRNRASVAHPNEELLGREEAQLVINVGRSLLSYLDGKLGA